MRCKAAFWISYREYPCTNTALVGREKCGIHDSDSIQRRQHKRKPTQAQIRRIEDFRKAEVIRQAARLLEKLQSSQLRYEMMPLQQAFDQMRKAMPTTQGEVHRELFETRED